MMRLGVCAPPENAALIADAGFDYIECAFSGIAAMDEDTYTAAKDAVLRSGIKAEAFNLMLPATVRATGADFSLTAVRAYMDHALKRAVPMGCRVIVFGSGGARRVPEGYGKRDAYDDLAAFLRTAGDRCAAFGITIAIEPLNMAECNILNSVSEAVWVANRAGHPCIKALVDNYHSIKDGLTFHEVRAAGRMMAHTHVSHPDRSFPKPGDGYDYMEFIGALNDAGYEGRMSVEGRTEDFKGDLKKAFAALDPLR